MAADMKGMLSLVPPGLLSLLNLKQRGFNPDSLSDTVIPVMDLTHWYGLSESEQVRESQAVAAAIAGSTFGGTSFSTLIVPAGEWWWIRSFNVRFVIGAAATLTVTQFGPQIHPSQLGAGTAVRNRITGPLVGPYAALAGPTLGAFEFTGESWFDFWAPPGSIPVAAGLAVLSDTGAANQTIVAEMWINRLKI